MSEELQVHGPQPPREIGEIIAERASLKDMRGALEEEQAAPNTPPDIKSNVEQDLADIDKRLAQLVGEGAVRGAMNRNKIQENVIGITRYPDPVTGAPVQLKDIEEYNKGVQAGTAPKAGRY